MIVKELKERGYRLKDLLRAIDLPRSAHYFGLNKVDKIKIRDCPITDEITQILHPYKEGCGVRRIYMELINQGYAISHKKV